MSESATRVMQGHVRGLSDAELMKLVTGRAIPFSLRALMSDDPYNLVEYRGLSSKAVERLVAALELGRRALVAADDRPVINSWADSAEHARKHFINVRREEVHVLCLNSRNVLVHHARVAEGSVDSCSVDPRDVFAPAVAMRAAGIVVVHNHPAGDPEPSIADVTLTKRLQVGAQALGIRLHDHLVLGHSRFVSLAERGVISAKAPPRASLQSS